MFRKTRDWLSVHAPTFPMRHVPIESWPSLAGHLYGVRVPSNTPKKATSSPGGAANTRMIFQLLDRTVGIDGDIAECGVFRGETILPIGAYLRARKPQAHVFGFDSFEGFGKEIEIDLRLGGAEFEEKRLGGLGDTSLSLLQRKIQRWRLESRVTLVKGFFENTLGNFADRTFSFVHLDCDIYKSYETCLEFFYRRMPSGGIILLDEYNDLPWPGCNKAVDEFLQDKAESLERLEVDNYEKWAIVKI